MELTVAEKTVIGTIIFLLLALLGIGAVQLAINQTGVDLRQIISKASPSNTVLPDETIDSEDGLATIEIPQPADDEEINASQPRRAWTGWALIIVSSLLVVGGLAVKFLSS